MNKREENFYNGRKNVTKRDKRFAATQLIGKSSGENLQDSGKGVPQTTDKTEGNSTAAKRKNKERKNG